MTELPLSLSVVTDEKLTVKMLERGTPLPASKTRIFTAKVPLPSAVMIELVRGERFAAVDNKRISRIRIGGIKKTVGDVARIAVKVEVSEDGEILLEAFDYGSHHRKIKRIGSAWVPQEEEIERILQEAQGHMEEENLLRERNRLISQAKATALSVKSVNRYDRENISKEEWIGLKQEAKALRKRTRKLKAENLSEEEEKILIEEMTDIHDGLMKL